MEKINQDTFESLNASKNTGNDNFCKQGTLMLSGFVSIWHLDEWFTR